MHYLRFLAVILSLLPIATHANIKSDAYNHLVYNFALIQQGVSPKAVKDSFTKNIALERVPEEFLPIYKDFLRLSDELQINFEEVKKYELALAEQEAQESRNRLMSLAKNGVMAVDLLTTGGSATTGLSFLSKFISGNAKGNVIETPASLESYQLKSKRVLTEFEFDLRLARKLAPSSASLTLKDAKLFVEIEKQYQESNYAKLLELDARVSGFYPIKYSLGKLELYKKEYAKSYDSFDQALSQLSEVTYNADIKKDILEQLIYLGVVSNKSEAIVTEVGEALTQISPDSPFVHLYKGLKRFSKNDIQSGLESFALAVKGTKDGIIIPVFAAAIQCSLKEFQHCHDSFVKIKELEPDALELFRDQDAAVALKEGAPDLYSNIYGLSLEWSLDWHMLNYDRVLITNTSPFKWSNIQIGNTFKESHANQAYRPFENYWFNYGELESGKTLAVNIGKTTKAALEYIDIQVKTDQGNTSFRLRNSGQGNMRYSPLEAGGN